MPPFAWTRQKESAARHVGAWVPDRYVIVDVHRASPGLVALEPKRSLFRREAMALRNDLAACGAVEAPVALLCTQMGGEPAGGLPGRQVETIDIGVEVPSLH